MSKFIGITTNGDAYVPDKIYDEFPSRKGGFSFRSSRRWYQAGIFRRDWSLPYMDQLGKYTGHTLYVWKAHSHQVVASVVSTLAKRLETYCRKHNSHELVDKNLERIVRVSYLYACTRNGYLWDRVLFFSRNLEKYGPLLHRIMLKFLCKTSNSIRFVYGHVVSQTQWLLFRAERPRDKLVHWRRWKGPTPKGRWPSTLDQAVHIDTVAQAMVSLCPPRF